MEWQPIETAPKDGTYVLVTDGKEVYRSYYEDIYPEDNRPQWFDNSYYSFDPGEIPTHWMPLPKPPTKNLNE